MLTKCFSFTPLSYKIRLVLTLNILKPTQVRGTRWLPHVSRALGVFVETKYPQSESGQYSTVLMHMEDLSVNSKVADVQG